MIACSHLSSRPVSVLAAKCQPHFLPAKDRQSGAEFHVCWYTYVQTWTAGSSWPIIWSNRRCQCNFTQAPWLLTDWGHSPGSSNAFWRFHNQLFLQYRSCPSESSLHLWIVTRIMVVNYRYTCNARCIRTVILLYRTSSKNSAEKK